MAASNGNGEGRLVWIDLEMTGLDTDRDSILEIATGVTDSQVNGLADGPERGIARPGVPPRVAAGGRVADVRQLDLPGPALPAPADAGARAPLPLPQPRREHAEG